MTVFTFEHKLTFGKHKGRTIAELLKEFPDYLCWCLVNLEKFMLHADVWNQLWNECQEMELAFVAKEIYDEKREAMLQEMTDGDLSTKASKMQSKKDQEITTSLFKTLREHNLCSYFILPLLELNTLSFGDNKQFKQAYLTKDRRGILVAVSRLEKQSLDSLLNHARFEGLFDASDFKFYHFSIPERWDSDVQLFTEGKYSQLSEIAKLTIIRDSGLAYRQVTEKSTAPRTDVRLLALYQDHHFRKLIEDLLDVHLSEGQELLDIPESSSYLGMEGLTRMDTSGEIPEKDYEPENQRVPKQKFEKFPDTTTFISWVPYD